MLNDWRHAVCLLVLSVAAGAPHADACEPGDEGTGSPALLQVAVQQFVAPSLMFGDEEPSGAPRVWLGIRFEPPGPALARQLKLNGQGLLITNVCKQSPAQRCGLQQFDVLVSFGGARLSGDGHALGVRLRELGPSAEASAVVLREAKELALNTKLASWPEGQKLEWVYEEEPSIVFQDKFAVSGQILKIEPGGALTVQPLDVQALPPKYRAFLKGLHSRTIELWSEDGRARVKCSTTKDDVVIEVEQDADGKIYVRHIGQTGEDDGGLVIERVYEDEGALQEADEEAYEVLQDCDTQRLLRGQFTLELLPNSGVFRHNRRPFGDINELNVHLQGSLDRLNEWREKVSKGLEGLDVWTLRKMENELQRAGELHHWIDAYRQSHLDAPEYNFHVDSAGRVVVIIRKGDNELSKVFGSEEELRQKSPRLFERFESIDSSE